MAPRELQADRVAGALAYLAIGLPLGLLYLALIGGGLLLGGLLSIIWLGLPLLLGGAALLWRLAELERRLANTLLEARISVLPPLRGSASDPLWARLSKRFRSRPFWRATTLLAFRLPLAALAAVAIIGSFAAAAGLLVLGVRAVAGSHDGYFGPMALGPAAGLLLCVLSVPVGVVALAIADVAGRAARSIARALLLTPLAAGAPVRETLAQSLGDRSLSIAYWLEDRQDFVDERGHPVPLPRSGSDRAWTAVDYEGRRVAAIIHDASLEASPELVQAAAAAASLALDNERLKADLRARLEELRASRVRIVEASNSARRRLERNLHDGAQQQLVALAVELRLLRGRVGENAEATTLIDRMEAKLNAALEELRELARGLHPGILTDRGLGPALEALATRAPLPIDCEVELSDRPPPPVEAVAYFVVAEALTNVLKYAGAGRAVMRARYEDDDVVVEMEDDGVGGADEAAGTGLQGLRDRVGALEGSLHVRSPVGEGTLVRARIPCQAATLVADARRSAQRYG